ncbi:O-methyltransferase COMT-type protein [Dioscorea alata]|uniref:O-methyltransferase COMT-type protein n=1 Tax=Dioscorea alata TaxID=55571 RepID=A0ACB7WQU5_DIOAL|nr:O-methyltransferase COMT-type protein [Dioscorea alata]
MDIGGDLLLVTTMKAMIELDVLEVMAAAAPALLSPEEIASKIHANNPVAHEVLDRMLRFLATYKVVTCDGVIGEDGKSKKLYGLDPVCKFFTKNEDGVSLAPFLLLFLSKPFMDTWANIKHAVLDGSTAPFVKTHGMQLHEGKDLHNNQMFNKAMFNYTTILMKKMLEHYKGFESINVLVDVGGGHGANLSLTLSKYPHIKAINFDLPHVVSQAKPIQGVKFVGGDMFDTIPGGDAIYMKNILHKWSDADCVKILKNCYKALPENGKIIIIENVIPKNIHEAKTALFADMLMLTLFNGGKERTENEYKFLAKKSGFPGFKIACNIYNSSIMEFYKSM